MQSIFKFQPIYKERPWGGRGIAAVGEHHRLPPGKKIGESWEISDRPGDESMVSEGEFQGQSIRWLLDEHGPLIMGQPWGHGQRFPLLIKLLDVAERVSLQVHPPAAVASKLGGEPKTEMWYLLDASSKAALMAGLRKGVRRKDFEDCLCSQGSSGAVDAAVAQRFEALIHRISVGKDDAMFVPSGRIHAIDAGCLVLEIQQNSDTTYRVYDWGRMGLDGKPRSLHVQETLRCTNFDDFEPELIDRSFQSGKRMLVDGEYFRATVFRVKQPLDINTGTSCVIHVLKGGVEIVSGKFAEKSNVRKGETALLCALPYQIQPFMADTELIVTQCIIKK